MNKIKDFISKEFLKGYSLFDKLFMYGARDHRWPKNADA